MLKTIREKLGGISQETFARRLGVSSVTFSRWERGITQPTFTVSQLKALKRELDSIGIEIEDLPDSLAPKKIAGGGRNTASDRKSKQRRSTHDQD